MADDKALADSLTAHGESLAIGLGITVGDYIGAADCEFTAGSVQVLGPGETPEDLPKNGLLVTHAYELAAPAVGTGRLGWFCPEALMTGLATAAGSEDAALEKLEKLAGELGENLATDKYTLSEATGSRSEDLWGDFLAGDLPPVAFWQPFTMTGLAEGPISVYLAWPQNVIERMFGPPPVATAAAPPPAVAATSVPTTAPPKAKLSPKLQRLLKTQVPVIVTLASKQENAGKILQIASGSIIEFEQSCDEPLQFSINNLPIGLGEAVKIGDHFGLRIVQIVPPEERLERLGGKWRF